MPDVVGNQVEIAHRIEFSCGPLPPPKTIEGYEAIVPGAAGRIISMADKQLAHRQHLE
ncbi:MAG: DUF2335 domain-containing protein [Bryobacterales bacterium]|nr:DUF2335 domain-containing protein [Bryobacterales bacterium]